ncbi:hypothetical protein ATK36_4277 [Amycolatopsis sulphurea]|uniref:2-oxoglutarate-Fe(II)-dependent oxygenase superfamily protein n=1 Tax=Amycolatopsis sulphurea TaxID=76022 RepID=A0A2A9FEE2_9PSEU|nr:2OG-Fe dioxygenase family protein [Amycolatopsis sulphurea]PFG49146.1 hypothetical protein ATK36_4277 [Amycolatopsis sulphurea]
MSAPNGEITAPLPVIARLRGQGFVRYRPPFATTCPERDYVQLRAAFDDMPADPYALGSNRFRRYSRLVYLPWRDELSWIPDVPDPVFGAVAEYWQDGHNPDFVGRRRWFPALCTALRENALLLRLVRANIEQVLWHEEMERSPIYVGVHLIKLSVADPTALAVSSPNCLHQDGGATMFTFAHLVAAENFVGGENVIATPGCVGRTPEEVPPGQVLARFRLTEPLDSYAVHDSHVSHYVSPVRMGGGAAVGSRSVVIMGIAPMGPQL